MNESAVCQCPESMRSIGLHNATCAQYVNTIPNEPQILYVDVPAPMILGSVVTAKPRDVVLVQHLNQAALLAAQAREAAIRAAAAAAGIDLAVPNAYWNYDIDTGRFTRLK